MGCPTTPLSCLTPENIFAGVYNPHCGGFGDPSNFQAERLIFDQGFEELINNFGADVDYYINTFSLSTANLFYGEEPTAPFYGPVTIRAYFEYENNSNPLRTFGWDVDDTVTMYIHINTFTAAFSALGIHDDSGQLVEPKADDGFIITPFGCDRPGGRVAKQFVITEVIDEDGTTLNPLMGHYVWKITAKRNDFSYEAGFGPENPNQVYDNTFSGILSSDIQTKELLVDEDGNLIQTEEGDTLTTLVDQLTSPSKSYDFDVDVEVDEKIFPTDQVDSSIYGEYY